MRVILTLAALLALTVPAPAADKPDELTPERRKELEAKVLELNERGTDYYQRGDYVKAKASFREVLEICRTLYPKEQYPKGHPYLVGGINNLAAMHQMAGEYEEAEPLFREAVKLYRAMYPKEEFPNGHTDLAAALNNLAFLDQSMGEYRKAEPLYREALDMRRALYPKDEFPRGHNLLALSINNLGFLHESAGEYDRAEPLLREALDMRRALFPKKDFPRGDPGFVKSLNNLAGLYEATGEYGKAEALFREALDMCRALFPKEEYPNGHPLLALGINNLGNLHNSTGEYDKAKVLHREALDMRRDLFPKEKYPRGHPDLTQSLNNVASLYQAEEEYGEAKRLYREVLEMQRALFPERQFPKGHNDVAATLSNLAFAHESAGEYGKAEPLFKEALGMRRDLFKEQCPRGHPDLARSLTNMAFLHTVTGERDKAAPLCLEALNVSRNLLLAYAGFASEAEALNYLQIQPTVRDGLLSTTRRSPDAAPVYEALWDGRAALTRLQERRHRDLLASRDPATAALADELRRTRLTLAHHLLAPAPDSAKRRDAVNELTEVKEDLEKRINAKLKLARPSTAKPSPKRLGELLPTGAAFVDVYRYSHLEQDPKVRGKNGEKRTEQYVAFVLRRDKPAVRVELKEAKPIDDARVTWLKAITAARRDEKAEREAATKCGRLLWEPLREALPADLNTVYLAPDPALSQVPWGALPGKKPDTVLLDECAVCLVPHGPFLLERLEAKPVARDGGTLVAYGGVDYDRVPEEVRKGDDARAPLLGKKLVWTNLPATAREQEQVVGLAKAILKGDVIARSGRAASTAQLADDLPRARYAHVATHGFFADAEFRSALQVDPKLFEYRGLGERRGGARSPSVLSGLVLAGANREGEKAAPDRGILTGEGLFGLRLEGLELAVLSACETGLGEEGGGEGVYGLQRSFHVAGCKDVIASLWKVEDGATQALMALFYRNLWEKKLDAAEALRQAQLTLYRNPAAVEVARKRGGLDFTESDLPEVKPEPAGKAQHSPAAQWAAFTFSGVRPPPEKK
jgi:CHAT domain-containing protein